MNRARRADWLVALGGLAAVLLQAFWIPVAVLAGMDEPYPNFEAFLASIPLEIGPSVSNGYLVLITPVAVLLLIVGTLWLGKHPRPWRAPSLTALKLLLPLSIWAPCWLASRPANGIGLVVPAPEWCSWTIFSVVGSTEVLLLLLLLAALSCSRQWLEEAGANVSGRVIMGSLSRAYHGE